MVDFVPVYAALQRFDVAEIAERHPCFRPRHQGGHVDAQAIEPLSVRAGFVFADVFFDLGMAACW